MDQCLPNSQSSRAALALGEIVFPPQTLHSRICLPFGAVGLYWLKWKWLVV